MLLILFFALFLATSVQSNEETLDSFQGNNNGTVDLSSMKICYMYGATKIEEVKSGYSDMGYKCTVTLETPTDNSKHAQELCQSRFPYYIIGAEPDKNNGGTQCTLQMNLKCDNVYTQIFGKCYKVSTSAVTLEEANQFCSKETGGGSGYRLAEFYGDNLVLYFEQMQGIQDAWVNVPNLKSYYDNAVGTAAIYVQDGAYKYDSRMGDILMDDPNSKHQAICEYTPPMTMAEMYYLANVYSEIYPITVYPGGAIFPTANFKTIRQTLFQERQKKKGVETDIFQFNTTDFDTDCSRLGKILNVESFPMTAVENDFNDVKGLLFERFYLTNAFKNDGCQQGDYRQLSGGTYFPVYKAGASKDNDYCDAHSFSFNSIGRYPTMAGMRAPILCALQTFDWVYGDCIQENGWEPPVQFRRKDGQVFCHYVDNHSIVLRDVASSMCQNISSLLTGFDSDEELKEVRKSVKPVYPPGSSIGKSKIALMPNGKFQYVDDHYFLGGDSPCENNCFDPVNKTEYVASWTGGVATNSTFLNTYPHYGLSAQDKVLISDATASPRDTFHYLKHLNDFLDRLDPYPNFLDLKYVPICESEPDQDGNRWNICPSDTWEADIACTQKYIEGNFLPTILCYTQSGYSWGEITREECIDKSVPCSENTEKDVKKIAKKIQKCVEGEEGVKLVKKAKKQLPKKTNRITNGFINEKKTLFNKPPKEMLCGLTYLKSYDACQPCVH
uniref:C-type lectin domain-containing protein n=1 Tax=Caenorhabditis tropicalis TaxID=1561998 RepID=A0A1I7UF82_9PELO